jgi:chanoclavine-I dehydrogenase
MMISGMGAAICALLAERGARAVCASDISPKGFDTLKESVSKANSSTQVHCTTLDVTKSEAVNDWIQNVVSTFGDLHGAANVAGLPQALGQRTPPNILEETDEMWHRITGVNMDGVFYCTRAQIRAMTSLKFDDGRGIVNISSMASLKHDPDIYAYRTSKAAVAHFSQSVAKETQKLGIRINCVSPGTFRDQFVQKSSSY